MQNQRRRVLIFIAQNFAHGRPRFFNRHIGDLQTLFEGRKPGQQSPHLGTFRAIFAPVIIFETRG